MEKNLTSTLKELDRFLEIRKREAQLERGILTSFSQVIIGDNPDGIRLCETKIRTYTAAQEKLYELAPELKPKPDEKR